MALKFTPPAAPPKAGSLVPPLKTGLSPEFMSALMKASATSESKSPVLSPRGAAMLPTPKTPAPATAPPPKTDVAPEEKPIEKVQTFYKQLSHAAVDLNAVSDELSKPIKVYEGALKKLNLGVAAWVDISRGGEDMEWWDRGVGYTRLKDGWGIALRTRSGNYNHPDDLVELWAFNDAPRWLRIEGVGKLPELLGALLNQAKETTKKLRAKVAQANELAEAIIAAADELAAPERK